MLLKVLAMGLTKHKIGGLISVCDERNSLGLTNFYGLNINKEFMPTVANTEGLDESKYKVVRNKRFVFSGMQTGRDKCIRISMYNGINPIIVSPAYTTFEIAREDIVLPEYFFMLFLSKEKDRFGAFCSDGSIRSNLDWERFCDFDITLPDIDTQQKFVNIYLSLQENLATYQSKVEELKLVCDGFIEELRRKIASEEIGPYIRSVDDRNEGRSVTLTQGVDVNMQFIPAKREAEDQEGTKIVRTGQFAFNKVVKSNGTKLPIALREGPDCVISSSYEVFEIINKQKLLPEYLMLWLSRPETHRQCGFKSFGTTRDVFPFEELSKLRFPIPSIEVQNNISSIYKCYLERQRISAQLQEQLYNLCPILIKGSLETI